MRRRRSIARVRPVALVKRESARPDRHRERSRKFFQSATSLLSSPILATCVQVQVVEVVLPPEPVVELEQTPFGKHLRQPLVGFCNERWISDELLRPAVRPDEGRGRDERDHSSRTSASREPVVLVHDLRRLGAQSSVRTCFEVVRPERQEDDVDRLRGQDRVELIPSSEEQTTFRHSAQLVRKSGGAAKGHVHGPYALRGERTPDDLTPTSFHREAPSPLVLPGRVRVGVPETSDDDFPVPVSIEHPDPGLRPIGPVAGAHAQQNRRQQKSTQEPDGPVTAARDPTSPRAIGPLEHPSSLARPARACHCALRRRQSPG